MNRLDRLDRLHTIWGLHYLPRRLYGLDVLKLHGYPTIHVWWRNMMVELAVGRNVLYQLL